MRFLIIILILITKISYSQSYDYMIKCNDTADFVYIENYLSDAISDEHICYIAVDTTNSNILCEIPNQYLALSIFNDIRNDIVDLKNAAITLEQFGVIMASSDLPDEIKTLFTKVILVDRRKLKIGNSYGE